MWLKPKSFLLIASHNDGKVKEIFRLFEPYDIDIVSAKNFNPPIEEIEESGNSFRENAALKAKFTARQSQQLALGDDSGLVVEALGGAPGILSARYAVHNGVRDFAWACEKIWNELNNVGGNNYSAYFICVLALAKPSGETKFFEGRVDGKIIYPPRGKNGFGYDPIFLPNGHDISFGEMDFKEKEKISHRAIAFEKFIKAELNE